MPQKDLDAQWAKKNDASYYGYKNSINIDKEHGYIRRYDVTPANIHDSQMLPSLVDPKNEQSFFFGDSAFAGKLVEEFLSAAGLESFIHEKGKKNNPLSEASKAFNSVRSRISALVEHVFGQMVMTMKGKYTRLIGLTRVKAWWGLRNLTFNMRRLTMKVA